MKIEQYKTIFGKNFEELDRLVKMEIEHGFQPYGNPYVKESETDSLTGKSFICQAMVRYGFGEAFK